MFCTLPLCCPAYRKTWLRLQSLEKCLELGDEPYPEALAMLLSLCSLQDLDVSADLTSLQMRLESVRREPLGAHRERRSLRLWSNLPLDMDHEHLEVRDSRLGVASELESAESRCWGWPRALCGRSIGLGSTRGALWRPDPILLDLGGCRRSPQLEVFTSIAGHLHLLFDR